MSAVHEVPWPTPHAIVTAPVVDDAPLKTDAEILDDEVNARADVDVARQVLDRAESDLASLRAAVESGDVTQASEAAENIPAVEGKLRSARLVVARFETAYGIAVDAANAVNAREQNRRAVEKLVALIAERDEADVKVREAFAALASAFTAREKLSDEAERLKESAALVGVNAQSNPWDAFRRTILALPQRLRRTIAICN